jgi:DNA-binding transcriptional ArsR family regulator
MKKRGKNGSGDAEIVERQVRICKAFANSTRLLMLDMLGGREWPVSKLQEELGVSKPNLSQHLAVLKAAGVVVTRRQGKQVYCGLAMPEVRQACHLIRNMLRAQLRNGRRLMV